MEDSQIDPVYLERGASPSEPPNRQSSPFVWRPPAEAERLTAHTAVVFTRVPGGGLRGQPLGCRHPFAVGATEAEVVARLKPKLMVGWQIGDDLLPSLVVFLSSAFGSGGALPKRPRRPQPRSLAEAEAAALQLVPAYQRLARDLVRVFPQAHPAYFTEATTVEAGLQELWRRLVNHLIDHDLD